MSEVPLYGPFETGNVTTTVASKVDNESKVDSELGSRATAAALQLAS